MTCTTVSAVIDVGAAPSPVCYLSYTIRHSSSGWISPEPAVHLERVPGTKDAPSFAMKDNRRERIGLTVDIWKHIA